AGLAGGKVPPGTWTIAGSGTQERFRFEELAGNIFGGRLTGRGEVAWKPDVRWNATVRAAGIDPGQLAAGFPGRLKIAARTQGRLEDAGPFGTVEVTSLQGTLRGQPVQAVADLRLAGSRHEIKRLNATWSTAKLSAAGWVGDALDLRWTLDAPNLAIAVPQGAGAVTAQGRVSGPASTPRIQADARGADLRIGTQTISEVTAVADVNLASNGTVVLDVTSRGIQSGERRIEELLLQGRGTRDNHTITATARNADGTLGLALAGGLATPTDWRGQIRQLDLRSKLTGDWSLTQPAALAASTDAVQVQDFCWRSRDGQLCADGGWAKAGTWNVDSTVTDLSFDLFKTFLPPDLEITGTLNGTARARGNGSVLASADVDLRPGPGEFRFPGQGGRTLAFRYEQGSVRAVAGAGGEGNATAHMTLVDVGTLDAQARLPRFAADVSLQGQPLSGRIDVRLNDIGFVEGFVPDLQSPKGALTAGYTLAGTVGRPLLTGEARLANGSADVPRLGLKLREIRLAAIGDGSGSLDLDASAKSGPGTLTMKGRTGLVPSKENPVQLAVTGRRFQAMDTEKIKVLVSPDLQVAYAGDLVRVTGDVAIPEADVEIKERGEKGPVKASDDVVFVNTTGEEPDARKDLQVATRVRLILGRDVEVNLFGLEAKPTGSLLAVDEPGKVTRGTGELELKEGTFKAYGQDLTIERGRLIFAGPLDNPGVDIRAYRKADDGTVAGINARGTARKPEVTLWSRPAMTDSETLSYLLLGRPLNRAQPQEGDRLANAATSLGIKGGNLLAKKLAARF
ncbi:MAG TPA: translocation/assembly module TamB domain-containing protein, partial [Thermoanaerobaculia bacterium]|nr:translocation/assembly module TamB domain-containing protein [Thermoanaerobaculia bacterium]